MPIISENYPDKLKTIYMPPFALFYNGNLDYLYRRVTYENNEMVEDYSKKFWVDYK